MLISCKCLNFIATSNNKQEQQQQQAAFEIYSDAAQGVAAELLIPLTTIASSSQSIKVNDGGYETCAKEAITNTSFHGKALVASIIQGFVQKYQRKFVFYSQVMDFLKQAIGPIPDLTINAVNQRDLIYSLTLDFPYEQQTHTWQISICINCNVALCAKRIPAAGGGATLQNTPEYLINCSLLTSNEELSHRRADKSFSDAFGILILDHPEVVVSSNVSNGQNIVSSADSKQRLKQLQQHLQQRLKCEIAATDERIQRYTEQQFALLKNFREKSEQEYKLLACVIQQLPEREANGQHWLDCAPPALEVASGVSYAAGRRNTVSNRRDITTTTPSTPTTPNSTNYTAQFLPLLPSSTTISAIYSNTHTNVVGTSSSFGPNNVAVLNRKTTSNFDTPPATPEAIPMSVGNSPTFRQQQQQQHQLPIGRLNSSQSFQQQFPTPTVDTADDCLFELEGVDNVANTAYSTPLPMFLNSSRQQQQLQQQLSSHQHQRKMSGNHNNMSDLDESDCAEEAEDALDLELSSSAIPMQDVGRRLTATHMANFAKSLPIEIAHSPMMAERTYIVEEEENDLDNNVDIAASIKALAKSVHGEAVFGDLPRPRLRSQI